MDIIKESRWERAAAILAREVAHIPVAKLRIIRFAREKDNAANRCEEVNPLELFADPMRLVTLLHLSS
jgi:hypothetical protein